MTANMRFPEQPRSEGRAARILMWDVEIAEALWAAYPSRKSQYLGPRHLIQNQFFFCGAWKWHHENEIQAVSLLDDPDRFGEDHTDDYHVIKTLKDTIESADVLVHHNGDTFDWKHLNTRSAFHGLGPVRKPRMIDTLKVAKKEFRFPFNGMDAVCEFLGLPRKEKPPEGDMRKGMFGNAHAIQNIVQYNEQDIRMQEALYEKLRPYITNHPNLNVMEDREDGCPKCGSMSFHRDGYRYTNAGKYQSYECNNCGGYFQGKKNLKKTELK